MDNSSVGVIPIGKGVFGGGSAPENKEKKDRGSGKAKTKIKGGEKNKHRTGGKHVKILWRPGGHSRLLTIIICFLTIIIFWKNYS